MTVSYQDYARALSQLSSLPSRTSADLEQARQTHASASELADKAVATAEGVAAETQRAVEALLSAARTTLEPLGKANLIPPQIRPSAVAGAATRDDIAKAQQSLGAALNHLRQLVDAEIKARETENERLAREAAERERRAREAAAEAAAAVARRKQLIQFGAIGGAIVLVLILILIVAH